MRLVSITYFLICVHISLLIINSLGVFDLSIAPNSDVLNNVNQNTISENSYTQSQVATTSSFEVVGDVVKALFYFVLLLAKIIFIFPVTMVQLGVPLSIAVAISIPLYPMYLMGISQIIGKWSEPSNG